MILYDLLQASRTPDSLGGYTVEREEDGDRTVMTARDSLGREAGVLKCDHTTIVDMQVDETLESQRGMIASALIRSVCTYADSTKTHLNCLPIVGEHRGKSRFMERFGFRTIIDGHMERAPGAVMGRDVLESCTDR